MTTEVQQPTSAGAGAKTAAAAAGATPPIAGLPVAPAEIESIVRNELRQLVVRLKGRPEIIVDARAARCFPWSLPESYISLRTKEGKEITLFQTLGELDAASRKTVELELSEKIFNPRILKVNEYRNEFGVVSISAHTDRGDVTFQIRSRDDIRFLSATRSLFRDADGNTFELPDLNALDPVSKKHLQEYF
jgi:hypothetical protein